METKWTLVEDARAREFTFGVEIETTVPRGSGVRCGDYNSPIEMDERDYCDTHGDPVWAPTFAGKHWTVEYDGTINYREGHIAAEFASPVLKGEEGLEAVLEMVAFLKRIGARVNSGCGFHVHVGIESILGESPDFDTTISFVERVTAMTSDYTTALYASTGVDRESTGWCRRLSPYEKDAIKGISKIRGRKRERDDNKSYRFREGSSERYRALNLGRVFGWNRNVNGSSTVEFRAFAGTLNPTKILGHIASSLGLCSRAKHSRSARWDSRVEIGKRGGAGYKAVKGLLERFNWGVGCKWMGADNATKTMIAFGLFGAAFTKREAVKKKMLAMAKKFDERYSR